MAIIRRKRFGHYDNSEIDNVALIDTPEKLLAFANKEKIETIPLDVEAIAEKFNIAIQNVPLDDDISGILHKIEKTDSWVIQVNKNHHPNRKRYTIAHELGHFCLHRHLKQEFEDRIFFRGGESSPEEWQANDFACAILMPEDTFRDAVRSGKRNIEDLAREFKVSTLALRIRAKNLGMTGHGL